MAVLDYDKVSEVFYPGPEHYALLGKVVCTGSLPTDVVQMEGLKKLLQFLVDQQKHIPTTETWTKEVVPENIGPELQALIEDLQHKANTFIGGDRRHNHAADTVRALKTELGYYVTEEKARDPEKIYQDKLNLAKNTLGNNLHSFLNMKAS